MIGWIITVAAIAAFGYMLYRMQKSKAEDRLKPKPWTVWLDLFPPVHFPDDIDEVDGRAIAVELKEASTVLWAALVGIYNYKAGTIPVEEIAVVHDYSKPVEWLAPHGGIRLRIQDDMMWQYAHELHNVFRYQAFGMARIYLTEFDPTAQEIEQYEAAVAYINKEFIF